MTDWSKTVTVATITGTETRTSPRDGRQGRLGGVLPTSRPTLAWTGTNRRWGGGLEGLRGAKGAKWVRGEAANPSQRAQGGSFIALGQKRGRKGALRAPLRPRRPRATRGLGARASWDAFAPRNSPKIQKPQFFRFFITGDLGMRTGGPAGAEDIRKAHKLRHGTRCRIHGSIFNHRRRLGDARRRAATRGNTQRDRNVMDTIDADDDGNTWTTTEHAATSEGEMTTVRPHATTTARPQHSDGSATLNGNGSGTATRTRRRRTSGNERNEREEEEEEEAGHVATERTTRKPTELVPDDTKYTYIRTTARKAGPTYPDSG